MKEMTGRYRVPAAKGKLFFLFCERVVLLCPSFSVAAVCTCFQCYVEFITVQRDDRTSARISRRLEFINTYT